MCTVVFYPTMDKLFFASIRDESPSRGKASVPAYFTNNSLHYLAPFDPTGGGTWVGINEKQSIIILLNGGFKKHVRKEKYRISRGLIVKELLSEEMPVVKWSLMDLEEVEPFTLIVWSDKKLFQLVWDGESKHRILVSSNNPHIWSSSTLYSNEVKEIRKNLFNEWIKNIDEFSESELLNFFSSFKNLQQGFIMNRDEKVKSLSITFLELSTEKAEITYHELATQKITKTTMNGFKNDDNLSCPVYF